MTMDNTVVQPGAVPPEGTVSPAVLPPPEPSPEEILNQKIAKAVAKELPKTLAIETEKHRRELQSIKDKFLLEVTTAQRRARLAESTMSATRQHLQTLDPDTAKEMELAEYRAEKQGRQAMEQEEQATRYQTEVLQRFNAQMTQLVTGLGIDPSDIRMDWGSDASDLLEKQSRIHTSAMKIKKEKDDASERSIDTKIKDAEKRIKKELGVEDVNSVSTQVSGGVSGEGIPTDMVAFRKWIAGVPQEEYETKYASKVNEMMREGKIK